MIRYEEKDWDGNVPYEMSDGTDLLDEMVGKDDFGDSTCIMAVTDSDEVAGIIVFNETPDTCLVRTLCVGYAYRGQGIGRHLLEMVMSDNNEIVLSSLDESVGFYEKMGFRVTERFDGTASMVNNMCQRTLIEVSYEL